MDRMPNARRVPQLLRSPQGIRHAQYACGAATEKVVSLLEGVFLQRPDDPIHHMLQDLYRQKQQQQQQLQQQQQQQQQQQPEQQQQQPLPDAATFGAMRQHEALNGLVRKVRAELARARDELERSETDEARGKADAVLHAAAAERAAWAEHWRSGGGVLYQAPGQRMAALKRTERRLTAPLPALQDGGGGAAHELGKLARAHAAEALGLTVERLLAVCVEAGRCGREKDYTRRATEMQTRRASGGGARGAAALAAAAAESAPALAEARAAAALAAARAEAAYYVRMNVGVPTEACEASVGCGMTAPLTAPRWLVEAAANWADACCGSTVEKLEDCVHEGGRRRREGTFLRKSMVALQKKGGGGGGGGPVEEALALAKFASDGAAVAAEAAVAAAAQEAEKHMRYFDTLNLMPVVVVLGEDDDPEKFMMASVVITQY